MQKGFTLIEVIIYIALFSILIGGAFVTAYQLIDGSGRVSVKNTIEDEGNFVLRKIDWALTGASTFSIPSESVLKVNKYDGTNVDIELGSGVNAEKILMKENSGSLVPITTDNVQVTKLQFLQVGINPIGVTANVSIQTTNTSPLDFTIIKYLRK